MIAIIVTFLVLIIGELIAPMTRQPRDDGRVGTNFGLGIIGLALAMVVPIGTIAMAAAVRDVGFGLFAKVSAPWAVQAALLLVLRSFASYWLHRASHALPWMWRFHRVHHSDTTMDVSTGLRSHPVEFGIALVPALIVTAALAPDISVVIAVDTMLFIGVLWQHSGIALPPRWERAIGSAAMTPAMHLRHHAVDRADHDSNYGDVTILWDRMFGTARAPADPRQVTGLHGEGERASRLWVQCAAPFRRQP